MAVKRKSDSRPAQGFFKWILKYFLTQVGCLSRQEFEEQYPPNGTSFENLIDYVDNSGTNANARSLKYKDRLKVRNDAFVEDVNELGNCESSDKRNKDKSSGGIMSFQNCTLQCAEQGNGESYWVSFEEKSFSKGDGFKVYSGRMNGIGPKSGEKCVVKVFRRCTGTENLCRCEVKKCQKAKALAREFNNLMHSKKLRVKFTTLYWAHMDEVSKIKQLFFTGVRKLTTRETVLFEDDLRVNDDKPSKHRELTLFMDCHGKNKRCVAKDLEAFAHFTYHNSKGELVLCGLDGVQDEDGFFLKTPTIHSRAQHYGNSDQGLQGILEVFRNHVCNDFCKDMIKPDKDLNNFPAGSTDAANIGQCSVTSSAADKAKEASIPQVVSCNYRPPFDQQNSVVSGGSHVSDHAMTWRQDSCLSTNTESLSDYLEPSAPIEDCSEFVFQPNPPPYSSVNVAHWLLCEQAQNSFINTSSFQQMPQTRPKSLVNQMSCESELGASMVPPSEASSFMGTSLDMNANFPDEDTSGISTSCCFDNSDDNDKAVNIQGNKKRVQFSLSSGFSSKVSSESFTTEPSDSLMERQRRTNGTVIDQFSSLQSRNCARSFFRSSPADNSYPSFYLTSNSYSMPSFGGVNQRNLSPDEIHSPPESPPSYTDSESTAAWLIMQRKCLLSKAQFIKASNADHDQQHTAIGRRAVSPSRSGTNRGLKKCTSQQFPVSKSS